jgi:hypothetical protein
MPLKGTREVRGKRPRRGAWLSNCMVSSNEADFNLRGSQPLSLDLARWDSQCMVGFGHGTLPSRYSVLCFRCRRVVRTNLIYPVPTEEPAVAGIGWVDNRHLNSCVESIIRNVGDPLDDAKESGSKGVETLPENLRCVWRESAWP